ncbi:photoreceptor cilium actin regulator [Hyla sarda]|uniref:photoreceptor cilium actin regulator n=1 Tax=Hyla sarda TaxID=327740 RepID=UPI0024C30AC6|nr:photoreceptor cilium actin regulator [Hyla sarda]
MGCAPSHNGIIQTIAKNAAKPLKKNKALLPPDQDNNGITVPLLDNRNEEVSQKEGLQKGSSQLEKIVSNGFIELSHNGSFSDDQGKCEKHSTADEGMVNLTYQKRRTIRKYSSTGSEQEALGTVQLDGNSRRNRKSKSQRQGKHSRRAKQNQAVFLDIEKKVDFPEELVKAHQDAYAFLNPNLSKYEAVISMANQTAQTHIIMQQMISFMALRFDDINQCLEEIAEDGEKLLKAVGSNLTWPLGKGDPAEHPDLLQQLLLYTINKMQSINGTVSSLTTNALLDTRSLLESAANIFEEKLKQKEHCNERLLKMIKSLEDLTAGAAQHNPNDRTLYSEDSGIGGDSESMRGYRSPDKMGRKLSIDSSGQVSLATSEVVTTQQMSTNKNKMSDINLNLKSTLAQKENIDHSSGAQKHNSSVSQQNSISSSPSISSIGTTATLGEDSTLNPESEDSTSSDESSDGSEDDRSLASQITLTQRPLTSPAGMGPYKHSSKWLENPENEKMTLKMKEAISEKIKFVPGKSISNVWTREEVNTEIVRPSTADGSSRRTSNSRRSRSAESLRSQAEDPTLLELQRTQKELGKKLEQLYPSTKNTDITQNPNVKSFSHTGCIMSSNNSSTNKLKACLTKSFNILPSQEKVALKKIDTNISRNLNSKQKTKDLETALNLQDVKAEEKPLSAEIKLDSIKASPRNSVRKLIQTFSPVDDSKKPSNGKTLGPLRCVRMFGVPVLPPTIPSYHGLQHLDKSNVSTMGEEATTDPNGYCTTSSLTTDSSISLKPYYTTEYGTEDFENLPPPPLEILMDDSFNLLSANDQENCTMKPPMSQKIKTSINIKNVLPSKNITDFYVSKDRACKNECLSNTGLRKYSLPSDQVSNNKACMNLQERNEIEQAANLYKQSHKIIHLQNPGDGEVVSPGKDTSELCSVISRVKPKQYSPILQRNDIARKLSPTRAAASSPLNNRKLTSPPTSSLVLKAPGTTSTPRESSLAGEKMLASPPLQRKLPSPPSQRILSSPPQVLRQQSPPSQRRLPSPPQKKRQQSPPSQHRQPSPLQIRRQQSPPSQHRHQSPPQILRQHSQPSQNRQPTPPQIRIQQSPPSQHRQPSPPQIRRQQSPPSQHRQPSPPQIRRQQSPPSQHRQQSPPQILRQQSPPQIQKQSPPSQRKLPSTPQTRTQQSPPSHRKLPSPPQSRREPSPPSYSAPSPPLSPSHTGLRRSSEDQQPSSKMIGNAQSIFCPSSSSLFEAKSPSPPATSSLETVLNQVHSPVLRHTFSLRQCDDQKRRVAMSAANPQPFVRRSYSDRRPRVQLHLPTSISANAVSELALQQTRAEESAQKDSEPAASQSLADPRAAGQTAAQSELCVVGQGLQKE